MAKLSWVASGIIIFSFASPASVMGVAFAIGSNGFVLGSCLSFVTTFTSMLGAQMLFKIRCRYPEASQLSDLGGAVYGWRGRFAGNAIQYGNLVLFLPVALMTSANGLQSLWVSLSYCRHYYTLFVAGIGLVFTQVRSLGNTAPLAYISGLCVAGIAICEVLLVHRYENPTKQEAYLFANAEVDTRMGMVKCFLGLTALAWGYVPSLITTELTRFMKRPDNFPKALFLSGAINVIFYIGLGTTVVSRWGWDMPDPANVSSVWLAHMDDPFAKAIAAMLLLANLIAYTLSSCTLTRNLQRLWAPSFRDEWTVYSCLHHLVLTLPVFAVGVFLAIIVPDVFVMVAFTTCLTVPAVTQIYPAVLYMKWQQDQNLENEMSTLHRPYSFSERNLLAQNPSPSMNGFLMPLLELRETYPRSRRTLVVMTFAWGCVSLIVCTFAAFGKALIPGIRVDPRNHC